MQRQPGAAPSLQLLQLAPASLHNSKEEPTIASHAHVKKKKNERECEAEQNIYLQLQKLHTLQDSRRGQ
jgi:hypothetical protein